jgi:ribonuclease P protein component
LAPNGAFFILLLNTGKPYSLGRSERLKSRKQIDQIFKNGEKITLFPFRLLYKIVGGAGNLKAGFTVSSKNFASSVDRNRIKRLCREGYRLQKKELETGVQKNDCNLQMFFIYTGKEISGYKEISDALKKLLDKLVKILNEKDPANT